MRDITRYPITLDEKRRALGDAIEFFMSQRKVGDIRGAALRQVLREIDAAEKEATSDD